MNIVEKSIHALLETNPYYAHFFLNSKIVYDKYGVPTAGAAMTLSGPVLCFNTEFISKLTPQELGAVIEHEVLHLLFEHTGAPTKDPTIEKHIANLAMDVTINQYISNLPNGCITLDVLKANNITAEPEQTWEYYYNKLMQRRDEMLKQGEFDVHDMEECPNQVTGQQAKAALRKTMDDAAKVSKGNIPSVIAKVYDSLTSEAKIPWQQVLSNFIARTASSVSKNTRKRVNRRFGIDQPGKLKKRELTLGVCVDSSGSISDESYQAFLNEIDRISSLCSKVYVIEADCQVHNVEILKKKQRPKRERNSNGGTAYQPAIDHCKTLNCDAIVYFGDFDTSDIPTDPGKPFLWVGVGNQEKPANFGFEVRL